MISLTKVGEDAKTISLSWAPVPGARSYRLTAEKQAQAKFAGPGATQAKFSKGSTWYKVEALELLDEGVYPLVPASGGLSSPYFDESFVDISPPEWDTIQTYHPPGYSSPASGVQQDPSGRLSLVPAPDGVGRALRFEIRQSDPQWMTQSPAVHRCQLGAPTTAIWDAPQMTPGDIRWFDFELWIPDEFDWARNDWNALIGIHPTSSTGWGAFNIVVEGPNSGQNNAFISFKLGGGTPAGTLANLAFYPLIRLTNADGSIYTPNRNRRVHLRYGGKFNPDNTGWAEAWVDGVNVLPRISRPTCWADDFHQYMKLGPYKLRSSPYPSGKTVLYVTRAQIGYAP